ncbi:MAG TPA: dihydrofolate reductase family protein [Candidatus Saccharimonadales bacterium]|nr:dihydrofolate reductase family protein [Candidatus Saccharimonadales bacterium]
MAKVIFGMSVSVDGFINDKNGSVAELYPDFKEFTESDFMKESIANTGAVVMGRRTFEMADDPDAYADSYEYQTPIFVITEQAPAKTPKSNDRLSFTFVNNAAKAVEQAKQAAGSKNVMVVGGPNVATRLLNAGLIDELQVSIVPVILGDGQKLFEGLNHVNLKKTRITELGQRTTLEFLVLK